MICCESLSHGGSVSKALEMCVCKEQRGLLRRARRTHHHKQHERPLCEKLCVRGFAQCSVMSQALLSLPVVLGRWFSIKGSAEAMEAELSACVRLHPEARVGAGRTTGSSAKRYYCCWHLNLAHCSFLHLLTPPPPFAFTLLLSSCPKTTCSHPLFCNICDGLLFLCLPHLFFNFFFIMRYC